MTNPRLGTPPRRTRRQAEGDLRFLLAGCAAQAIRGRGGPVEDHMEVLAVAQSALDLLTGQGREGGDDHKGRMVAEEIWGEVAVEAFIPQTMVLVVLAVSAAWPAVEAIAADLLARRRISGRRARRIYLEAGGPRLGRW